MINSKEFSFRLQKVIDYYNLSASSFADKIGVQRSSISHVLSGRNKPSLDFVMKILNEFPEVELYWLINGKGSFPSITKQGQDSSASTSLTPSLETVSKENTNTDIDRIVIFYKDGTFKSFTN